MRVARRSVVVILVLAVLLVAVDRVGAWLAGKAVADQLVGELAAYGVQSTPDADIGGFPFLTQVLSGEYDEITARLGDVESMNCRSTMWSWRRRPLPRRCRHWSPEPAQPWPGVWMVQPWSVTKPWRH